MADTWWKSATDLSEEQQKLVGLPVGESHLITGPPGSGKTNLALLRANYLYLSGAGRLAIVVFTGPLQKFIVSGSVEYAFPLNLVKTSFKFYRELLIEYGQWPTPPYGFAEARQYYIENVERLIEVEKLGCVFDTLVIDEAQDYLPIEIELMGRLARHLYVVADRRQKIYKGEDPFPAIRALVDRQHSLRYHYRNGIQICRLADKIASGPNDYVPLAKTCNYNEKERPSKVELRAHQNLDAQVDDIIEALSIQIRAYPDELLGVMAPRRTDVARIWAKIRHSALGPVSVAEVDGDHVAFTPDTRVCITTIHSAKGLEFRTAHLAAAESLMSFTNSLNAAYTAVTRAKTSFSIYHSEPLPGFLESAIKALQPVQALPRIDDLFGGR